MNSNKPIVDKLLKFTYFLGLFWYGKRMYHLIEGIIFDNVPEAWGLTIVFFMLFTLLCIKTTNSIKQFILYLFLAIVFAIVLVIIIAIIQTYLI